MIKVLFVCTGNICRSPTAEGVFRHLVARNGLEPAISTDSAGTHAYHTGEPPDPRSILAAGERGIDIDDLRARQVRRRDFEDFDMVLAMDRGHHQSLARLCPPGKQERLRLFLDFAPHLGIRDVPDPYFGSGDGFTAVLDMTEAACHGLLEHIRSRWGV